MPTPLPGQLRNLDQPILDNAGGLEALWYADVADVLRVPDPDEPAITTDIEMSPGGCWYQLVASRQSLAFTQDGKDDRHGDWWQPKLSGALAKATPGLAAGLEALDGRRLLVLFRDHNGLVWLLGSLDEPVRFSDKYSAGSVTARNNYDFTFSGDLTRRVRPYLGTWVVSELGVQGGLVLGSGSGSVQLRTAGGQLLAVVPAGRSVVLKSGFKLGYQIV